MRTKNFLKHLILGALVLTTGKLVGQVTTGGNVAGANTDFLGWENDPANDFPLRVRHDRNWPIDWYTNAIQRMRLMPTGQSVINGYTLSPTDQDGFLLLSATDNAFTNVFSNAPFSRLHLVDDEGNNVPLVYAQEMGYRPWMRNGITFTGNSDQGYIGQQYMAPDATDMVIQWSDNPESDPWAADRMRFVFASDPNPPSLTGMSSLNGLEAMRLYPVDPFNVNVGIGDWLVPGSGDPLDRLDILTGRLRIRNLPTDPQGIGLTKVLVVDDQNPADLGVVKWLDISNLGGPCTWGLNSNSDVHTAWDGFGCDPQAINNVGVGTSEPMAKIHSIRQEQLGGTEDIAVLGEVFLDEGRNVGVAGFAKKASFGPGNPDLELTGARGMSVNAWNGWGVVGIALNEPDFNSNALVGVYGEAWAQSGTNTSVGVWGRVSGNGSSNPWAGWFDGRTHCTTGNWSSSDGQFKQQVSDIEDATQLVRQLAPKSYYFDTLGFDFMGFDSRMHYGLIAQELEQVVPEVVATAIRPAVHDVDGMLLEPEVAFKAVNYEQLIPILIGALNEQVARIDQLEADLASCCTLDDTGLDTRSGTYDGFTNATSLENDRLTIAPNPFQERTTLSYLLETPAQVRLQVHTESGMHLATLRDQPQEPGSYSMTWDTQDLAPGLYYVTLFADGKPVVKKAVKVR